MNPLQYLKSFFAGTLMGIAAIIPGVSSGTIALITGVYKKTIDSFDILLSKQQGKWYALAFLLTIITGMLLATFLFASLMESLLARFPIRMNLLFAGLILGTIPSIVRQIKTNNVHRIEIKHLVTIFFAFLFVVVIGQFSSGNQNVIVELTFITGLSLFIAGILSTGTAIIPGISGSMLLVTLGMYGTMISAMSNLYWPLLLLLGLGSLVGFVMFSKMMKILLKHYTATTYSLITGFLLGSIVHILPYELTLDFAVLISYIVIFLAGFFAVLFLGSKKRYV